MIKESIEEYVKALNTLADFHNQRKDQPPFRAPTHLHDFVLKHGEGKRCRPSTASGRSGGVSRTPTIWSGDQRR